MRTQSVYLDTSVIGGCFDEEFTVWSNGMIADIRKGLFTGVTSSVVAAELRHAPKQVKQQYERLVALGVDILDVTPQVEMLADAYLGHHILAERFRNDLLHIALASAHGIDILVSWNFKHIVHFDKIAKFNAVNLEYGFRQLAILSPREVTSYDQD